MNREIKYMYHFDNHAPMVVTLEELESGTMLQWIQKDFGNVTARRVFTGLKDRNGKEVFEGDLFNHVDGVFEIAWDSHNLCYSWRRPRKPKDESDWPTRKDGYVYKSFQQGHHDPAQDEIIGNIYEHPELLKQQ